MIKAIRIHAHGGPDFLQWEDVDIAPPAPGEARVRHTAIALNFSDINIRRGGFYQKDPLPMPLIPGNEAAGIVESVGAGVTEVKIGDRVGYVGVGAGFFAKTGAYAEQRNVPANLLAHLPAGVSDIAAATVMLKGLTASNIVNKIYRPAPGDHVLIHAAASGVGLLLTQWCAHFGAVVIGTVGNEAKARIAREHGAAHVILYRQTDFVAAVKAIIPAGVRAVLDGVGKDTFEKSMDCAAPFGTLVNYGNASGHVPPIDIMQLSLKGTLSMWRPGVSHFLGDPARFKVLCAELFEMIETGVLKNISARTYALKDARQAHIDAEAAQHAGPVVLLP